jgi:hypothetical protein
MNKSVWVLMLFLTGCVDGKFFLLPDQQNQKLATKCLS